jgi:hypothetical protein
VRRYSLRLTSERVVFVQPEVAGLLLVAEFLLEDGPIERHTVRMQRTVMGDSVGRIEAKIDLAHLQLLQAGDLLDRKASCVGIDDA